MVLYSCLGDQWCCIPVQVISGVVLCTGVPYSCPVDQWCCPVYRSYLIPVQVISGVVLDCLCIGRVSVLSRQSLAVSKATLVKRLRNWGSAYGLFRAHIYHLELNGTAVK